MADEDPLDLLARWLTERRDEISKQVTVRKVDGAYGERTSVAIDHRLGSTFGQGVGWRISTKPTFIPAAHFHSYARHCLKTAEASRGRTIYCHDPSSGELVAAISYHIDDKPTRPVLLTMLGIRTDAEQSAYLRNRTLGGLLVIKHHIHVIAAKAGRGGYVDLDLTDATRNEPYARLLGFRKAPDIPGLRFGGLHLRQAAPSP